MEQNRRRTYLCNKPSQWRYLRRILLLEALVVLVTVPVTAFATLFFLSGEIVLTGSGYWTQVFFTVLFLILFLGATLLYIGVRLSNRIYGPAYRFTNLFRRAVAEETIPLDCVIRDHDDFQDLSESINQFLQWLHSRDRDEPHPLDHE